MPAPDQKHENQRGHAMAKDIMDRLMSPTPESQLAHEVAELRRVILALRPASVLQQGLNVVSTL